MNEVIAKLRTATSLVDMFEWAAEQWPSTELYRQSHIVSGGPRTWLGRTYGESLARVRALAKFLWSRGVRPGDKVAILSNTRPEWLEADLAILMCGGVVVSVYPSVPIADVGYILFDSGVKHIFAENEEQCAKLTKLLSAPSAIPATEDRAATTVQLALETIIGFDPIPTGERCFSFDEALTRAVGVEVGAKLERGSLASLVYTSGTTGPVKGVMQTHGNHLANIRQAIEAGLYPPGAPMMLLLPLSHSFTKLMGYLGFLTGGALRFPAITNRQSSKPDPESWLTDLRNSDSQVVPIVPRFLEKMKMAVEARARHTGLQPWVLRQALSEHPSPLARPLIGKIRRKIRRGLFGPGFRYAVSGGAKLPVSVNEFFQRIGATVYEGYGLTETCVATNCNRAGRHKIGSVGQVLTPDIEVAIAEDGEILFRGPNVALGYLHRPTATRAAWDAQGWFHTGDIGHLDAEKFLYITGRKKEIIVTAGGKKIAPERIENLIKRSPLISQAVVVGDGRPFCVALIVINPGSDATPSALKALFDDVNRELASFETLKHYKVLPEEMTQENGLLTPTLKVKRHTFLERYRDVIDALYREVEQSR